jgi:hypothetical protein
MNYICEYPVLTNVLYHLLDIVNAESVDYVFEMKVYVFVCVFGINIYDIIVYSDVNVGLCVVRVADHMTRDLLEQFGHKEAYIVAGVN